jgi:perosamine synthetase
MTLNQTAADVQNSYWMPCALFTASSGLNKQRVMELMAAENIECRPFFPPLSALPAFQNIGIAHPSPISYQLSEYGINLPSGAQLTQKQVQRVCRTLERILERATPAHLAA